MSKKYELTDNFKVVNKIKLYQIRALRSFGNVKAGDLGGFLEREENLSHEGDCWVGNMAVAMFQSRVHDDAQIYGNAQIYGDATIWGNARISGNAHVAGNASISENACVGDNARVWGDATIWGNAQICGNVNIYSKPQIYGNAQIFGNTQIWGNAQICGNAQIFGNAFIFGDALIFGDAEVSGTPSLQGKVAIGANALIRKTEDVFLIHPIGEYNDFITFFRGIKEVLYLEHRGFVYEIDDFKTSSYFKKYEDTEYEEKYLLAIELAKLHFK